MKIKVVNKIIRQLFDSRAYQNDRQYFLKRENWENMTVNKWSMYTSPFRPSLGDIKNYEKSLENVNKKRKILIFGSTPEIRDIVAKMNSEITVADFSQNMIEKMLKFTKNVMASKEKLIVADWLSLNKFLKNNYFDVVLGDLVLRNIEPELQENFLNKVSKLLTHNGFFITRVHFINESMLNLNSNHIVIDAFNKYFDLENKSLEELIASRLFDKNTDFKQHNINKISFLESIKEYSKNFSRNERERLILNNILQKWGGEMTWTQRSGKEINDFLAENFVVISKKIAPDYKDSEFYPIYILKNK